MTPFAFEVAANPADAVARAAAAARRGAAARFVAGGTNLVDLMKLHIEQPAVLVDLNRLGLDAIEATPQGGLRLGALARNADTAVHPLVTGRFPLLRSAILAGASPQLRNRASNGGNLLQRTRCVYFYDPAVPCNKRRPGSGCPAAVGFARQHAILGADAGCVATHPSDFCVALAALDAVVHVQGPDGARRIAFGDFHRLPGDRPDVDTTLDPGELITAIELPPNGFAGHSSYLKLRERASYAFALVSVAAALEVDAQGRIAQARVALGGVAHKPWRDPQAEALLQGRAADAASFEAAAELLLQGARAWGAAPADNAFKIPLARRAVVRALAMARDGIPTNTGLDAHRARQQQQGQR